MSTQLQLTILGCGSSPGTPRIMGDWGACDPTNPKNRRTRCSALVERVSPRGRTSVIIDCGPDFRQQMLAAEVRAIDAVLITHPHADHIHGLDDVRGYVLDRGTVIDLFADSGTYARLYEAFAYCFETPSGSTYPPIVRHRLIEPGRSFVVDGQGGPITIMPFTQIHGAITSLGFRIGPIAYCSDVSDFPSSSVECIAGAEVLIIDALQYKRHPSHLSVDQALDWIRRLGVRSAYLTHMHTPLDYQTLYEALPSHVRPAFDGLVIPVASGG